MSADKMFPLQGASADAASVTWEVLCQQAEEAELQRIATQLEQQHPGFRAVVRRFIHDEFEYELIPKESP